MSGRIFLDTNALVYAYDRSEPEKQQQAIRILDALGSQGRGAISAQVLAEFFVAITLRLSASCFPNCRVGSLRSNVG